MGFYDWKGYVSILFPVVKGLWLTDTPATNALRENTFHPRSKLLAHTHNLLNIYSTINLLFFVKRTFEGLLYNFLFVTDFKFFTIYKTISMFPSVFIDACYIENILLSDWITSIGNNINLICPVLLSNYVTRTASNCTAVLTLSISIV